MKNSLLLSALSALLTSSATAQGIGVALDSVVAFPQPVEGGLFPAPGATEVPIDTLVWTTQFDRARLVGPDGELDLFEVARFSDGFEPVRALSAGELPPETEFTILSEDGAFELGTFTTGVERAAAVAAPTIVSATARREQQRSLFAADVVDITVAFEGMMLIVEPDGSTLPELVAPELVTDFTAVSFPLPGPVTKRYVTINVAGEMSAATDHTFDEGGGCRAVTGESLVLWPMLMLLAAIGRRRARSEK